MPVVDEVNVEVTVGDSPFEPTNIVVEQSKGNEAGDVELEGVFLNGRPYKFDDVEVTINGFKVFTGQAIRATRDHTGLYTINAYDNTYFCHQIEVPIETEGQKFNAQLARRLLSEHDFDHEVASAGAFDGYDGPTQYTAKRIILSKVLDKCANRLGGYWWTDRDNTVHLKPDPPDDQYTLEYIKSIKAGENDMSKNEIVVFGGSEGTDPARRYVYENIKSSAEITFGDSNESEDRPQRRDSYKDQNMSSQAEVDAFMTSKVGQHAMDLKHGECTAIGYPEISPYNTVTIPDIEDRDPILVGDYGVKRVRHVLSNSDGYVTEMDLMYPYEKIKELKENQGEGGSEYDTSPGGTGTGPQ